MKMRESVDKRQETKDRRQETKQETRPDDKTRHMMLNGGAVMGSVNASCVVNVNVLF